MESYLVRKAARAARHTLNDAIEAVSEVERDLEFHSDKIPRGLVKRWKEKMKEASSASQETHEWLYALEEDRQHR